MAVIYVDVLFLINFLLDYLLLCLTSHLRGYYTPAARILLGAAVGGLLAVGSFFLPEAVPDLPLAAVTCSMMLWMAWGWKGKARFFGDLAMLWTLAMLLSGGILLLAEWSGIGTTRGGAVYLDISVGVLLSGAGLAYGLLTFCCRPGSFHRERSEREVFCRIGEREACFRAFVDTGNLLRAPGGQGILLISPSLAAELLGEALPKTAEACFLQLAERYSAGLLPYRTAEESGLLVTLRPDRLEIDGKVTDGYILGLAACETEGACGCRALIGC